MPSTKQIGFVLLIIILALWPIPASAQKLMAPPPPVGGPCDYVSYKGSAKIVSIMPRRERTYSEQEYEIIFIFLPEEVIKNEFIQLEGQKFFLRICGVYFPTREFIKKYDIKVGKIFPCVLNVIVHGSCTPDIFEFPFIEETQKLCPKGGIPWPRPEYFNPQSSSPKSSNE